MQPLHAHLGEEGRRGVEETKMERQLTLMQPVGLKSHLPVQVLEHEGQVEDDEADGLREDAEEKEAEHADAQHAALHPVLAGFPRAFFGLRDEHGHLAHGARSERMARGTTYWRTAPSRRPKRPTRNQIVVAEDCAERLCQSARRAGKPASRGKPALESEARMMPAAANG